jgi:hypothetical protein
MDRPRKNDATEKATSDLIPLVKCPEEATQRQEEDQSLGRVERWQGLLSFWGDQNVFMD